jgi:hypothetical protein
MRAAELARLVETWSDAQTIAEIMNNPHYQVTEQWDFRGWQALDFEEGITFQHVAADGQAVESVRVTIREERKLTAAPAPT